MMKDIKTHSHLQGTQFKRRSTSKIDVIISYGVSINLTNVGKEDICCWKDGWCLETDACKENEKRERSC